MFKARKGEATLEEEKLSDLKKLIDTAEKKRVRTPAIFSPGYGSESQFVEGEITSISVIKGVYGKTYDAWVSWKDEDGDSRREKERLAELIKPTADNKKLIKEINALRKEDEAIEDKISKLRDKLEHFKPSDFGYEKRRK